MGWRRVAPVIGPTLGGWSTDNTVGAGFLNSIFRWAFFRWC